MMKPIVLPFLVFASLWTIGVSSPYWADSYSEVNNWKGDMGLGCLSNIYLSAIYSYHDNSYEDRKFKYMCSFYRNRRLETKCETSDYLNDYDGVLHHVCGQNSFINGMSSTYSDDHNDRRFKIRCCKVKNQILTDFKVTDYLNDWDREMNINLSHENGRVIVGIRSYHDNRREDRRTRFITAKLKDKKARRTDYINVDLKDYKTY